MIIRHSSRSLLRWYTLRPLHDSPRHVITRPFHASRPHHLVNEALHLSAETFHFVHNTTHLPWGLSIPLTTALCQLVFTPLYYAIDRNRKLRSQSAELLFAWQTIYGDQAGLQKDNELTSDHNPRQAEVDVKRNLKAKGKEINATLGVRGNWFTWTTLLYFPVWMTNVSTLNAMCTPEVQETLTEVAQIPEVAVAVEPALMTDGMLWFSDLTIADPTFLLPVAMCALFVTHVVQLSKRRKAKTGFLQGLFGTMALLSGPIFIANGVSNAVILAMMGSTVVTITRSSVLHWKFGTATEGITPAKPRIAVLKGMYREE